MSYQALPYIVLLGFLFGSTLVASRFSVGQFAPTTYIGLRLVLASLGHTAIYLVAVRRRWPRDPVLWRRAGLLGVLGTAVPMTAIVSSLQFQSSGITAVLITTNPAITVLLAHFVLADERLNGRKSLGVILALGGALLLAIRGETGLPDVTTANPLGYALVLVAMLFGSSMTIYARRQLRQFSAFDVASVRMLVAALVVMPLSLIFVGFDLSLVTSTGYAALGYAALVGTFAGMMLAFHNIQRFGATAAAMAGYVIPVVAAVAGTLVLDETITAGMMGGMALIISGIALINQGTRVVVSRRGPLVP
ncbi:MAG: DMT family transporter [Candidatus Promineifilaceae bacterium]|nr:DMT family transporter [Candidatus Promineifilaceae bacterium]